MDDNSNILKNVKPSKIILPILIGLVVVVYFLYKEFDPKAFALIKFTWHSLFWIFIAFLLMVLRDIGYMIRLRILSDGKLSWKKIFNIIMLWEFTSAITPSAVGGTSVATYFIYKEGISLGKSTAIVLATSFLDEMYFLIVFPLVLLFVSSYDLFTIAGEESVSFTNRYFYFAVVGYSIKFIFTAFVIYGLFFKPEAIKKLLVVIFSLRFIKKWKAGAEKTGDDLILASIELKNKPFKFWIKTFFASLLSWTSRYWVVNALLLAFFVVDEHFLIFARQLVMWIMMLVMPTPGGSGFAEVIFRDYLGEFVNPITLAVSMALLWRLVSYYPYLFIGAILVPRWFKGKYAKK
ncbi:MAG TPA: TIGR00374 family protein [Bacteroidales bacterium]|nr:MAG: hypothetical protein A2W98_01735 [Bacteroidetes bacterium GWF2_33_38]OFY91255.1 MAG: hypothetical protein A2236_11075 [Bacteroidetes bacterium RIFOXYA2_FULL_33_7]HBF87934.1 TIGR00374 family protein [Bacteroidales bacterium]